jgi:hypothetical protein
MAITVWPVNAVNGSPQYAGRALRQTTVSPFSPMGVATRPLGALSGVRVGTPSTTVSATSTTWTCAPHAGVLDLEAAAEAGAYSYSVDASVSGSVNAADSTNARIDIVYAQLSDPAESDGSTTPGVAIRYLAGTASGTPAAPATPARSLVLAQISVPKSGGGSPSVTWAAPKTVGGKPTFQTRAQLLALWPSAPAGLEARVEADPVAANNGEYVRGKTDWARRGIVWAANSMEQQSFITPAGGRLNYEAYTFTAPVEGTLRITASVMTYLGSAANHAGRLYAVVDDVDIFALRFHNQGVRTTMWPSLTTEMTLSPGTHTIRAAIGADGAGAGFEVWSNGFSASFTV